MPSNTLLSIGLRNFYNIELNVLICLINNIERFPLLYATRFNSSEFSELCKALQGLLHGADEDYLGVCFILL